MNLFLKVLPLIIQIAEELIKGRGTGKQKLHVATEISKATLREMVLAGQIPEGAAHETGALQATIQMTVGQMNHMGLLSNDELNQKQLVIHNDGYSARRQEQIHQVTMPESKPQDDTFVAKGEIDLSKLGL